MITTTMYRSEPSRCWESLLIVFLIVFLTIQLQGCLHLTQVLNDPSFDGLGEAQRLLQIKPVPATDPPAPSPTRRNNITYDFSADRPGCGTATVSTDIFVPIFVMTRDRVSSLRETLESYKRTIASPYSIIILDHNSTYPPMLDYLAYLQSENNVTVHTLRNETWNMACVESADYIGDYLRAHPDVQYYVFTDPDIALVRTAPDILLFYAALLEACPDVRVVGPQLQISDLPPHYTRKKRGQSLWDVQRKFWQDAVPYTATWRGLGYHLVENGIDSTFALRRRTQRFFRQRCPCIRTYAPYAAVHLDWYYNTSDLPADKEYYLQHAAPKVNNW